jgi:hypothetical protein
VLDSPSISSSLTYIHVIIFAESYKLWSSSLLSLIHPPAISSLLGPNTLSRCSSCIYDRQIFTSIQNNKLSSATSI